MLTKDEKVKLYELLMAERLATLKYYEAVEGQLESKWSAVIAARDIIDHYIKKEL